MYAFYPIYVALSLLNSTVLIGLHQNPLQISAPSALDQRFRRRPQLWLFQGFDLDLGIAMFAKKSNTINGFLSFGLSSAPCCF